MKTLHLYLTRQVLASLFMTVAVFTFVLLLGSVLREILSMLVNRQANMWTVANAVGLLLPFVLAYALPMGLLTATLLTFGRFSADQELTAVRAGGVSLLALITPTLLLSLAMSCVCAVVNLEVAPRCRVAYKGLLYRAGLRTARALIAEKTFIKDFKGYIVYIDKVEGDELKNLLIYVLDGDKIDYYFRAARGRVLIDDTNNTIRVWVWDAFKVSVVGGKRRADWAGEAMLPEKQFDRRANEATQLSDMSYFQLRRELRELEKQLGRALPYSKGSTNAPPPSSRPREFRGADLTMPVKVQIHRQVSFSFACLGFTLVGIPLGIRAHRRETTFGMAMALVLVGLYYSFYIVGQGLETRPEWSPHLILWLPNFIFQAVGMVLLWRANRGI